MIVGIGIDIVDNRRIRDLYQRYGDAFIKKILHENEMGNIKEGNIIERLSGTFATKEAVIKALSHIHDKDIMPSDIIVFHNEHGSPFVKLDSRREPIGEGLSIHISISHEVEYSVAMAVIERND
jgi:holo-[acyl-carrier protein] synthase